MIFVIFANYIIQDFIIIVNSKTEIFTTYLGGKHKKQKSTCRNKYFSHWGSRIRTCECSSQSAVSYRLTIPQYGDIIAYPPGFVKRFMTVLARTPVRICPLVLCSDSMNSRGVEKNGANPREKAKIPL